MLRKFVILLFILLIPSLTFASSNYDFEHWITIGFIIVTIHIVIVALSYMYSNFFMTEDLKGWSKNEIIQAVFSLIILGSFMVFFTLITNISEYYFAQIIDEGITIKTISSSGDEISSDESKLNFFCYEKSTNRWSNDKDCKEGLKIESDGEGKIFCKGENSDNCNPLFLMARSYLGISFERLGNLHKNLLRNYALMTALNTHGFNTGIQTSKETSLDTFGFSVALNFITDGVYINLLESLIIFVEKILLMLKFQESVLKFMEYGLAFYLIILGLIFRSIFIFRKFGGLLLSLGVCFMFVLPLLYVIGWYTLSIPNIEVVLEKDFDNTSLELNENWVMDSAKDSFNTFLTFRFFEFLTNLRAVTAGFKSILDVVTFTGEMVMLIQYNLYVNANSPDFYFTDYEKNANDLYVYNNMGVFDYISRFIIIALALPLLNIYIFFSFVRGLSPLLGGDAEIPALGRFL